MNQRKWPVYYDWPDLKMLLAVDMRRENGSITRDVVPSAVSCLVKSFLSQMNHMEALPEIL